MSQAVKEVKASTDSVLKLTIKPANDSDWLQVYLEDFGKSDIGRHAGRLVLVVGGEAYTHYWSHMSTPLIEFIQNASCGYLIMKLTSGELNEQIHATGDEMIAELVKEIFEQRRDDGISKEAARELYDDVQLADWEQPTDEHELLEQIYGCDWWECIPKVDNPEYDHLFKVIDLLKQGLAQHDASQGVAV